MLTLCTKVHIWLHLLLGYKELSEEPVATEKKPNYQFEVLKTFIHIVERKKKHPKLQRLAQVVPSYQTINQKMNTFDLICLTFQKLPINQ